MVGVAKQGSAKGQVTHLFHQAPVCVGHLAGETQVVGVGEKFLLILTEAMRRPWA